MKQRNIFNHTRTAMAVMIALTSPAALQLAQAGAGWGDSFDAAGGPIKTPTYYANSPSGVQDTTACFTAPPATGAFDTLALTPPSVGANCDTGTALRKFIDPMSAIPVAVADTAAYPGSDYYEIAVVEYTQQMHSDLAKATRLRGYVQLTSNANGIPLTNIDGTPINLPNGTQAKAVAKPSYLGPIISATSGTPTRVKFYNLLPAGSAGNLHVPVDETLTGAGTGPDGVSKYQQNRVEIHLHGGDNPWISDGTPHQWILPAADEIALSSSANPDIKSMARGVGAVNVPDMPNPGPGAMTYYFPNGQSGRMMFYHDHSLGLTRLNVYSGVVAGYMINDLPGVGENYPSLASLLPSAADTIPLIIQDKTFIPKDIATQDAKWRAELGVEGDLWYPHVYETNQDPNSVDGTNPVGRWDWGPWFWPVFPSAYSLPTGEVGALNAANISEVSTTPEAFMDTPVVNGTAYPTMTVEPKAYRFRVLNGANDRFLNLGLYLAADKQTTDAVTPTNSGATVLCDGRTTRPDGSALNTTDCTEVKMVNFDASYVPVPAGTLSPDGVSGFPTTTGITGTGWGAQVGGLFPQGAPDPATAGPDIVQIGNEGGLLANPLVIPSTPLNYEYNKRSVTVLNVLERGLYLGNAERADVLIDFSKYAGKTLILYNDAPAPVPASDPRIDYYTGNGDNTGVGGAPSTKPGYGPNTRTIMQIVVAPSATGTVKTVDVAALQTTLPAAYASKQAMPVVPEPEFKAAFPSLVAPARNNARIYTGSVYLNSYRGVSFTTPEDIKYFPAPTCTTVAACNTAIATQKTTPTATAPITVVPNGNGLVSAPAGTPVSAYVQSKAIQELFDPTYGRMNATLGVELPFTTALTQTTIPLGYVDPATETVADGETQFWKITHNGVDTHPVHFHLVNVQVINRIGWDGTVKVPYGDEIGWKETVKMNPLEDIIVAVRAKKPTLQGVTDAKGSAIPSNAFGLPVSQRLMDPSQPLGANVGFTQVDPSTGNPAVVTNQMANYGWEYVWHCHILGHEENDFMRPVVFNANELAPAAPTGLTLGTNVDGNYVLTWADAATTEYMYKVEHATTSAAGIGAYTDLTATVLPANQKLGEAPLANATTFTDKSFVAPGPNAVTAPVLNAPTASSTSVALSWPAVANAVSYSIERANGLNAAAGFAPIGTSATPSYSDTTVTAGNGYSYRVIATAISDLYRVTAVGANGNSSATVTTASAKATSSAVNATTLALPAVKLVAVNNLVAQANSANAMQLNWTDGSTLETGYRIQRCTGSTSTTCATAGAGWVDVTTGIAPAGALISAANGPMTATLTANLAQNTISYRVYPLNGATAGPVSNTVSVDLTANPVAPTNVTVSPAVGSVALTWVDKANNNTEYRIRSRYQTAPGVWSSWTTATVNPLIGANAQAATLTAAQIGGTYVAGRTFQFQVGARNQATTTYTSSANVIVK